MPELSVIVAVSSNGVIGCDGGLPWHLPQDMRRFRDLTMGKPLLMGRKTFESIGRPLPGRANIVVTRDPAWSAAGVRVAHSIDEALAAAAETARAEGVGEIMVIGGAQLYADLLPRADRLYLTEVHMQVQGDTRLPPIDWRDWCEVHREDVRAQDGAPCDYSFVVYERATPVIPASS